jgi:anti-sigma factor (TIGR02949 family)
VDEMSKAGKIEDMGCLEAIETLYAWLDNELGDADNLARFEHHLEHCKSCFSRAELEKTLTEHIRRSDAVTADQKDSPAAPETLQKRLDKLLKHL